MHRLNPPSLAIVLLLALAGSACSKSADTKQRLESVYDQKTGKLQELKWDSNGDGKVDTWGYMDGTRVLRIEIDKDGDGKVDRWEYYGEDKKLEKVGFSRAHDGREDAWAYSSSDGTLTRVEISLKRDGKINRIEYYEAGKMVRAEEDGDGDGRTDKWETYDGARLASVAFDSLHRGKPDRRLVYAADGTVRLEVDQAGTGQFIAAPIEPENPRPVQRRQGSKP